MDDKEMTAALEARLVKATEVYREQRARIAELEAALAAKSAAHHKAVPVVTRYTDAAGLVWEKTRIGNKATARLVQ